MGDYVFRLPRQIGFAGILPHKKLSRQEEKRIVQDEVTAHLERTMWVVTKVYGNGYYDIQKGSSLVLDFDFNTGTLTPNFNNYTNTNPDKHEWVWNATNTRLGVGDMVRIGFRGQNVTQKAYIKSLVRQPFGQQTTVNTPNPDFSYGEWMQTWGHPYLDFGQIGNADPVTLDHVEVIRDTDATTEDDRIGMGRCNLGLVSIGSNYIWVHGVANAARTGIKSLKIHRLKLSDHSLVSLHELMLPEDVTENFQATSNMFWNPDQRWLNLLVGGKCYSIKISEAELPITGEDIKVTDIPDSEFMTSVAWDTLMILSAQEMRLWTQLESGFWGYSGTTYIQDLFPSGWAANSYDYTKVFSLNNRGVPAQADQWRSVHIGKGSVNIEEHDHGYGPSFPFPTDVTRLEPHFQHRLMRQNRYDTGVANFEVETKLGYTGRTLSGVAYAAAIDASSYPQGFTVGSWGGGPGQPSEVKPAIFIDTYGGIFPTDTMYEEPAPSAPSGSGFTHWFSWYYENWCPDQGEVEVQCPVLFSNGKKTNPFELSGHKYTGTATPLQMMQVVLANGFTVYACLVIEEVVRYSTQDLQYVKLDEQYKYGLSKEYVQGVTYEEVAADPESETYPEDTDHYKVYTPYYSMPKHTATHSTRLRVVGENGGIITEYKLNQQFEDLIPNCSEAVDMWENVWAIRVGQRGAETDQISGRNYADMLAVLYDWREAKEFSALRKVNLYYPQGAALASSILLSPVDELNEAGTDYKWVPTACDIQLELHDPGAPGMVALWVRMTHLDTDVEVHSAFSNHLKHELVIYDITDLANPVEYHRRTEITGTLNRTNMCSTGDFWRLMMVGGKRLSISMSDNFGPSIRLYS